MSQLPRALSPWAEKLALLHRELAIELSPWVQRLATAVGAFAANEEPLGGAPDGYDGISLRGPYERLLPTEWLYADEVPEEFLRRATQGEHNFYRLAEQEPKAERRCVVVFDAGPSQLGTPRIAHLAALLVFATRAEAAKANFWWGTLQSRDGAQEGFNAAQGQWLLDARSAHEGTPAQVQSWFDDERFAPAEMWLVGSRRTSALPCPPHVHRLELEDVIEPDARALEVTLRRRARPVTRFELALPPPEACTRLLRNPFLPPAPVKPVPRPGLREHAPIRLSRGLLFSRTAERLYCRDLAGNLVIIPLPTAASESSTRPFVFQYFDEVPFAAGWSKGNVVVTAKLDAHGHPAHYSVHRLNKRGDAKRTPERWRIEGTPLDPTDSLLPVIVQNGPMLSSTQVRIPSHDGVLSFGNNVATLARSSVVDWLDRDGNLMVLRYGEKWTVAFENPGARTEPRALDTANADRVLLGAGGLQQYPQPAWAERLPNGSMWRLFRSSSDKSPALLEAPKGEVLGFSGLRYGPVGLVTRSPDRRVLTFNAHQQVTTLVRADSPITFVALDANLPRLAWLGLDGTLGLVELESGRGRTATFDRLQGKYVFSAWGQVEP